MENTSRELYYRGAHKTVNGSKNSEFSWKALTYRGVNFIKNMANKVAKTTSGHYYRGVALN
jgi:hypothetical protein